MAYIQLWRRWVTDSRLSVWPTGAELVSHTRSSATSHCPYLHHLGPSPITSHMQDGGSIGLPLTQASFTPLHNNQRKLLKVYIRSQHSPAQHLPWPHLVPSKIHGLTVACTASCPPTNTHNTPLLYLLSLPSPVLLLSSHTPSCQDNETIVLTTRKTTTN